MKTENELDKDQQLEDSVFSDPMCVVEIIGWSLFIVSLLIGLAVAKLGLDIENIGWGCFAIGLSMAFWGSYKRDRNSRCRIKPNPHKSKESESVEKQ